MASASYPGARPSAGTTALLPPGRRELEPALGVGRRFGDDRLTAQQLDDDRRDGGITSSSSTRERSVSADPGPAASDAASAKTQAPRWSAMFQAPPTLPLASDRTSTSVD